MKDNLDTSFFNTVNTATSQSREENNRLKIYKKAQEMKKAKLQKRVYSVVAVGLLGGFAVGVISSIVHEHNYEKVLHGRDYASEGQIVRVEDLNQETWAADYKFVNENATVDDAVEAYHDGQYFYYIENDGEVKIDSDLQNEEAKGEDSIKYYNSTCVDFADEVLEELNIDLDNQKSIGQ